MWKYLLGGAGLAAAGAVTFVIAERARFDREVAAVVEDILDTTGQAAVSAPSPPAWADLPAPIQRYLRHVRPEGAIDIRAVRLQQRGSFRSDPTGEWRSFTATQHVSIRPPGFLWNASIDMMPLLPVRVVDTYHDGRGGLWAKLGGVLTVVDMAPSPELDEGELMRYLAEAPLYPTSLLPGFGVSWTPIDDRSARATLEHRGTTASLVFHVNERDEVESVAGERAYAKDDGSFEYRPWRGYWRNYAVRNGMRVPLEGEVAWEHPDGEVPYWRGHIEGIEHLSPSAGPCS